MKKTKKLFRRMLVFAMTVMMVVSSLTVNADTTDNAKASKSGLDTSNIEFDVANPDGYVTISFTDNGVRPDDAVINNEALYGTAVGTIIADVKVPFVEGDSVADVTVRLLDAMDLSYSKTGSADDGFYLSALEDFELNETYYPTFGEFDAGAQSGWCVRVNNWHINQSTSAVEVEDEDAISWLYTCQFGADIGADFSTKSAEITGIQFASEYGTLSPEFSAETDSYTYAVDENISTIAFAVELENYAAVTSLEVDGKTVKYRPNKEIAVTKNSKITISTKLDYMDAANNNKVTTYADSVTIQLKPSNTAPTVVTGAPTEMSATAGEEISLDLSSLFTDADSETLTYNVKIETLNLDQDVEGSLFKGTIPAKGEYEVVVTASDGVNSVSHTMTLKVVSKENKAPNIKAAYADTNSKTYVHGNNYVYIYMDDIFEDADGDTLTYKATCNGEEVAITYNSWSKQYYIQFAEKPIIKEYKIVANDGQADSEVFTAKCIGTSATITAEEDSALMPGGTYYYYVMGSEENDTFTLDYAFDVDTDIVPAWTSSNENVLTSNGDGTFTVADTVTTRQTPYVGVAYGKDNWGSAVYLGTKYFHILPAMPTFENITSELAEHADNVVPTTLSNALSGGWYTSEFEYTLEDPTIADITTSGSYGLKITPKALGTTKVTATFIHDESIKAEFDITVTGRSLHIKDQPDTDSVIYADGKTVQMEVKGAEEGETFTWTSADETVATIDENGLVTIKGLGQTYITATSSLSTEAVPVKASMYLQVKEKGKVYLEEIAFADYSYFEDMISSKSAFNSAQLEYDLSLLDNRHTYNKLAFTPYFDDENLDAVLSYQVSGGEYQEMSLENEKAVNIANGLMPGENVVTIKVSPKDDAKNVTIYTFNIFRTYNPANTISRMTLYPDGETALAYPAYKGQKEGTLFQWDTATNDFKAGWGGRPATGWSSSQYTYKAFVFGKRTESISIYPSFAYTNQRVQIWVDGEYVEEAVTNWKSSVIEVGQDTTEIVLKVVSEKVYAEETAKGNDPFDAPENTYTIYIESVEPLGIDAEILSAKLSEGEFYLPGFSSSSYSISALVPADCDNTTLTFTVPDGIDVYKGTANAANKLTPVEKDEDGNNVYETATTTITGTGMYAYSTTNIILQVTDPLTGETGMAQYGFTTSKRGAKDVYPDSIVEYLCIGSQYTNAGSYGLLPERTLKDNGGVLSLGNFGGYITYKYDTPIENDPNNPYGVDFVIYGNSFGNGGHEPGYVQVSQDGKTWYTLAGSEHFDDHNDWDFSMTYSNANGKSAWTNSDGESGEIYSYPKASLYPYYTWTEELEESITVSGPRLNSSAKDAYGSAAAVLPVFGYVDVNTNGKITGISNNPYNHPGTLVEGGDMFDLDWAVDTNGMPVDVDEISYIRVATASSIYAGAIGEKSTEISAVLRTTNTSDEAVGKTARTNITVNGKAVKETSKDNVFTANYESGEVVVKVDAADDAHVYINNAYGTERTYSTAPEKSIIRVIVQEGEKEPYIAYVVLGADEEDEWVSVAEIYKTTGDYLENLAEEYTPIVNTTGGEWQVVGLARSGRDVPDGYYDNVVAYVKENINEKGQLHWYKSTENSRVILALTAAGYDPTDVAGYNLLEGLTDMKYVPQQGINGAIWALIAFDAHDYEIPEAPKGVEQVTREKLVDYILAAQLADAGWTLRGTTADIDMTAMAIQALAPYYDTDTEVKAAVDKAIALLSSLQNTDGGFYSTGEVNSEACAQVVVALTALGINPETDARFVKDGNSVVDALCKFYVEGGGFSHTLGGKLNGMSTEQGYYALVSYARMLAGQTSLYDMSDVMLASTGGEAGTVTPGTTPEGSDDTSDTDKKPGATSPNTGDFTGGTPIAPIMMVIILAGAAAAFVYRRCQNVR